MSSVVRRALDPLRQLESRLSRRPEQRRLLVDARTPVNYTMFAPVVRALERDTRLEFFFTASEEPGRIDAIYREANGIRKLHPARAALLKFDVYVASDFMWAILPRGARRVQIFHGVAGKYRFDAPTRSMRDWDRLFFVNERRLRNFIKAGAIDPDSPAIRLIGMPKVDCLVDGTYSADDVKRGLGLDPSVPTVLYAPTWSPESSLNALGTELVAALLSMPINVIVKLHDRSLDPRRRYSGGVDWNARLRPLLARGRGALAPGADVSPYLVAADLMITDHSSAGFEFLILDKPLVRIHRPQLIKRAMIHPDYVNLLASASESVTTVPEIVAAVERGLSDPITRSAERRRVAGELFYRPGTATARAAFALYELLDLEAAPVVSRLWQSSCERPV